MSVGEKPRLIVHIGAGKTGSSSIQRSLRRNQDQIRRQGFKYLGLMLEHAVEKSDFAWNVTGGSDHLFGMDAEQAGRELYTVLSGEMKALEGSDVHSAIWSNEWMLERAGHIVPALGKIRDDGVEVMIVCYVRQHEKWVTSAYAQWGIKYKTYEGPIRPFETWKRGRSFAYYPDVAPWLEAFPKAVALFNYDAAGEIVRHFCDAVGCEPEQIVHDNITPATEVLAAWAVFNNRFNEQVIPGRFMQRMLSSRAMEPGALTLPDLAALFPDEDDLAQIRDEYAPDREQINRILESLGEPPLSGEPPQAGALDLDPWKMNQMLLLMIFNLQEHVARLRRDLRNLSGE